VNRISAIAAVLLVSGALNCFDVATAADSESATPAQTESPANIYRDSIHAVFTIRSGQTLGSGFTIASGYLVTNAHVVGDSTSVEVEQQNGDTFRAKVVKKDSDHDFAILEPEGIRPFTTILALPSGSAPAIGEGIVVIGSPGGMKGTLTTGVVSQIYPDGVVQLNVAVNPGNSGGPVLDMHGRVFGIAAYKYTKGDGIGFAIPISWVKSEEPK